MLIWANCIHFQQKLNEKVCFGCFPVASTRWKTLPIRDPSTSRQRHSMSRVRIRSAELIMTVWVLVWVLGLGFRRFQLKRDMCRGENRCCAQWAACVAVTLSRTTVGLMDGRTGAWWGERWAMENNWNSEISYLALGSCLLLLPF